MFEMDACFKHRGISPCKKNVHALETRDFKVIHVSIS